MCNMHYTVQEYFCITTIYYTRVSVYVFIFFSPFYLLPLLVQLICLECTTERVALKFYFNSCSSVTIKAPYFILFFKNFWLGPSIE